MLTWRLLQLPWLAAQWHDRILLCGAGLQLALDHVILPSGLGLGKLPGLLTGLEPSHDIVLQLIAVYGPTDATPAAVPLGVDPGDGEAAGSASQRLQSSGSGTSRPLRSMAVRHAR